MVELWNTLPTLAQDALFLLLMLLPGLAVGVWALRGYAVGPMLTGLLRRHAGVAALFTALIAFSVALGTGLVSQERAIREGTARAAQPFDLVVAAPGSEFTVMMAAVYLQPSAVPLLDGNTYQRIASHERVAFAAPIAFGDSYQRAPVVGTTPQFVHHLAGDLEDGRVFRTQMEAVAGARVELAVGDSFSPAHGVGDAAEAGMHAGHEYTVTGRMPLTGTPWDRALLVPVEGVWAVHGLASGHPPEWDGTVGPPFDPEYFPGTPAVLVRAQELWHNYALQSAFTSAETMAFFPGTVLARLHAVMGDVRQLMSVLAIVTQVLVAAGVLAGLLILGRLLARRLALLRALGAPARYIVALTWSFAAAMITGGAVLGLGLGALAARIISGVITSRTDILVTARLGWPEFHLVAGFASVMLVLALLPAVQTLSRTSIDALRS